jgi:hypothetical protein
MGTTRNMGVKNVVETTTNRGEFNRAYKNYLESSKGKISCSRCRYHRGENYDGKWYGGHFDEKKNCFKVRYPNWKLVSKQNKQWMKKPIEIVEEVSKYSKRTYVEIKFST